MNLSNKCWRRVIRERGNVRRLFKMRRKRGIFAAMHCTSAPDNNGYTSDSIDLGHRGTTLADKVYEQLFGWISNGQYARQSKLPSENELARSFEVSRPVIRDALKRLRDDGVMLVGKGDKFQLWNPRQWQARREVDRTRMAAFVRSLAAGDPRGDA